MCLIISGPAGVIRATLLNTPRMLDGIFNRNSDGVGAMYRNKSGLKIAKVLPRTSHEATTFISQLPQDDRPLALHWRMRTHGDVDKANCHPYVVVPGKLAMMHNGVLATGNAADPTKSDTWHFIEDFLKGPAAKYPGLVHEPSFVSMLESHIGSNRFVFMDDAGTMTVVNEGQGIKHGGMWFSNTYAWDPALLIEKYRAKAQAQSIYPRWGGGGSYTRDVHDLGWMRTSRMDDDDTSTFQLGAFVNALNDEDIDTVAYWLDKCPKTAITELLESYEPALEYDEEVMGQFTRRVVKAAIGNDVATLVDLCTKNPEDAAYALSWGCVWAMPDETELPEVDEQFEYDHRDHVIVVRSGRRGWCAGVWDADDSLIDDTSGFLSHDDALRHAVQFIEEGAYA